MDIGQSLDRILRCQNSLGTRFYEIFLGQNAGARKYFQNVDLTRQGVLLTMALTVVVQYHVNSYPSTAKYLRYLGRKHHDRDIPVRLYADWTDAMLRTLAEFHADQWEEGLAEQWKQALAQTTERMLEGYEGHFTV